MAVDGKKHTDAAKGSPLEPLTAPDLEKYGVWVKSEPRDISDIPAGIQGDTDFDMEMELLPEGESDLQTLPQETDEDLSIEFSMDDLDSESLDLPAAAGNASVSEFLDTESDIEIDAATLETARKKAASEPISLGDDISIEEFSLSDEKKPDGETDEIDISDFMADESPDTARMEPQDQSDPDDDTPIEMDLTFDDTIEDIHASSDDTEFNPEDFEDTEPSKTGLTLETVTEFDDFLAQESESPQPKQVPPSEAKPRSDIAVKAPVSTLDDLPSIEMDEESAELPESDNDDLEQISIADLPPRGGTGSFDDMEAVERELSSGPTPRSGIEDEASKDLLKKIAFELGSIKGELSSLKRELAALRQEEGAKEETAETDDAKRKKAGFFDDDADETIALTGDELDNILNTADFTEETGHATAPLDSEEEIPLDFGSAEKMALSDLEDVIPENGFERKGSGREPEDKQEKESLGRPEPKIELVDILEEDEPEAFELHNEILEDIKPLSPPPEDTAYLEDDDLGEVYLEEPPLIEPDLTAMDNAADDSESPMEEIVLEDLALSLDDGPGIALDDTAIEMLEPESIELDGELLDFEPMDNGDFGITEEISLSDETDGIDHGLQETIAEEISLSEGADLEEMETFEEPGEEVPAEATVDSGKDDIFVEPAKLDNESTEVPVNAAGSPPELGGSIKEDIKSVLLYMDKLLESLPEEKIDEFAKSDHFVVYKKLFEELGLI